MPSDEELRERLKKQAEEIIEAIVANRKPAGENSLQDLERVAIQAGQGFEERVLEYLAQEESQAEVEPVCDECGRRMRSRGKRKRQHPVSAWPGFGGSERWHEHRILRL